MNILFHLRTSKSDQQQATIYTRVTVDGVRGREFSTNIKIKKRNWDNKKQCIRATDLENQYKNVDLQKIRTDIQGIYVQLRTTDQNVTANKILSIYHGKPTVNYTLNDVLEMFVIVQVKKKRTKRTIQAYRQYTALIVEHSKESQLSEITESSCDRLIEEMQILNYEHDYIMKVAAFLKQLLRFAESKELIRKNPLQYLSFTKSEKYDTTHLTQSEIERIATIDYGNMPPATVAALQLEADIFVFCCYTGYNHAEMKKHEFEIFQGIDGRTWIKDTRQKTNNPTSFPLHPAALAIYRRYNGNFWVKSNTKRNLWLKHLAVLAHIKINLTTKVARKSFASYALNELGMRLETVAALLGHSSTKYVRHYAKIEERTIAREMIF